MPRILISYRRADAAYVVTALYDKLAERYGDKNVFMDTDTIPAGSDFREHLEGAVQRCDVVLAIIGTRWRDVVDSEGRRRLDSPHDWVRIELETALSRKIPVIPLLVDDASMPQAEHLPESLRALNVSTSAAVAPRARLPA